VDVDYPGFGAIVVGGERFEHDVVVEAGRVRRRKKGPSKRYRDRTLIWSWSTTPAMAAIR
jgi:hypothetical protein